MLIVQEDIGFQRMTFNFLFTGNVMCGADSKDPAIRVNLATTVLLFVSKEK